LTFAKSANKGGSEIAITHSTPFSDVNIFSFHVFSCNVPLHFTRLWVHLFFEHFHHIAKAYLLPAFSVKQIKTESVWSETGSVFKTESVCVETELV